MPTNTTEAIRLSLAGDWTVSGVAEQFQLLANHFGYLSILQSPDAQQTCPAHIVSEMDLAGITALDACGCQLLSQFSRSLKQCGLSPLIRNLPDEFSAKIRLLGFDRELNLTGEAA